MHRSDLEHIIRASCEITKQQQVLIVGSQSILGTYSEYELPMISTYSEEADVFPLYDEDESGANLIDGGMGEMSQFHITFGYYAQGVSRRTATLSPGWEDRLVPIRNENTRYFIGWCLEVHDTCASKLIANRDKDREFVAALLEEDLVSAATIRDRIIATDVAEERKAIALSWLKMWPVEQPNFVDPGVSVVPSSWPDHPSTVLGKAEQAEPVQISPQPQKLKPWDTAWPSSSGHPKHDIPEQGRGYSM